MKKPLSRSIFVLPVLLAAGVVAARGQTLTQAFTYQGQLKQNGSPFSGTADLTFTLWEDAASHQNPDRVGNPITLDDWPVVGGLFTVTLNAAGEFGANAFNGQRRWLQVVVNGVELTPRQELTVAPHTAYAIKAGNASNATIAQTALSVPWVNLTNVPAGFADGIDNGGDGHSLDAADGSPTNALYVDNNGNVGIGTLTPNANLHVSGAENDGTNAALKVTSGSQTLLLDGNEIDSNYSGGLFLNNNNAFNIILANGGGNIGIGTSSPATKLQINDNSDVTAAGGGILTVRDSSNGNEIALDGNEIMARNGGAAAKLSLNADGGDVTLIQSGSGRVGIGTSSPNAKLQVNNAGGSAGSYAVTIDSPAYGIDLDFDGQYGLVSTGTVPILGITNNDFSSAVVGWALTENTANSSAIEGYATGATNKAGLFHGNVEISGNLSKGGGSFKIDHPLDPENKYLYHSFVESPDMKNIYDGVATTDAAGYAVVTMPDWFNALNRDFRYQLTVIDDIDSTDFVQAKIVRELNGNRFTLRTSRPNVKVSWQVTGIRQDAFANAHRIPVEEDKPASQRGRYLHPEAHGQPPEAGLSHWPEMAKRLQAERAARPALPETSQP